jgi:hypothetical protein
VGEARWTLIKIAAPDILKRYEEMVELLVCAESVRLGRSILQGKPTFGGLVRALATNPLPLFGSNLDSEAHHLRNAFMHGRTKFHPDDGTVRLDDVNWSWEGPLEALLARYDALNRACDDFETAIIAAFAESVISVIYELLDLTALMQAGDSAGFQSDMKAKIEGELDSMRRRVRGIAKMT